MNERRVTAAGDRAHLLLACCRSCTLSRFQSQGVMRDAFINTPTLAANLGVFNSTSLEN